MKGKFVTAVVVAVLFSTGAGAQEADQVAEGFFGGPLFEYGVANVYDSTRAASRLDVYYSFVYDILQFVKKENGHYGARYEISAILKTKGRQYADFKTETGTVTVTDYPETNSRVRRVQGKLSFWPAPGKYKLELRLTDGESQKSLRREKKVLVRDFGKPGVHLSDVLFGDSTFCADPTTAFPILSKRYTDPDKGFRAVLQVVGVPETTAVHVKWSVRSGSGEQIWAEGETCRGLRHFCLDLGSRARKPGRYTLQVEAKSAEGRAKLKARFSVAWGEAFVDTSDLDLILKAMRYIANKQDIERMEMASPSMRRQLYEDWWKARDPDPSTPENELRQEFFRRLDFANRYFSVPEMNIEGWETDRGRIYIIYGPPTHVEREPAEMNEASYETWYYSHLHRRFVFVDKSGTGLYELVKSD
ncbi:MAG: GWxTD domain-containing protein [Calditrichaeota bacterium]|nr:GWxTD domain-containing protein [Calditrichota bacterium]